MCEPKWGSSKATWMYLGILVIIKFQQIYANENLQTHLNPSDCYDAYGRPQVRNIFLN